MFESGYIFLQFLNVFVDFPHFAFLHGDVLGALLGESVKRLLDVLEMLYLKQIGFLQGMKMVKQCFVVFKVVFVFVVGVSHVQVYVRQIAVVNWVRLLSLSLLFK